MKCKRMERDDITTVSDVGRDVVLKVECGDNKAYLHLSRMLTCARSAGVCVRHAKSWLTPNEFQAISGRKAAKDWKRSIKHHGKSLKLLMSNGTLTVLPPVCRCEPCRLAHVSRMFNVHLLCNTATSHGSYAVQAGIHCVAL